MEITGTDLRIKDIVAHAKEKGIKVIIVDSEESIGRAQEIYGINHDIAIILPIERLHPDDRIQIAAVSQPVQPKVDIIDMIMESARRMSIEMKSMAHIAELADRPIELPNKSTKKFIPAKPKAFKGHTNTFKNHNFKKR